MPRRAGVGPGLAPRAGPVGRCKANRGDADRGEAGYGAVTPSSASSSWE
jgi:hypothetical protein